MCASSPRPTSNLEDRVKEGVFRSDLFYRMNAVTVRIPPLRERGGDVMLLANFFLNRFNQEFGRNIRGFTEAATMALSAHDWPGNVRELENRLKRAVVMADRRLIDAADLELAPVRRHACPTSTCGPPGCAPSGKSSRPRSPAATTRCRSRRGCSASAGRRSIA